MKKLILLFIFPLLITSKLNAQSISKCFTSAFSTCNLHENSKLKKTPFKKITAHTAAESIIPEKWIKKIYPMPLVNNCQIEFLNTVSGDISIRLYNITRSELIFKNFHLKDGENKISFYLDDYFIPQGIYLMHITDDKNGKAEIVKAVKLQ